MHYAANCGVTLSMLNLPGPKISSVSQANEQLQAAKRNLFTPTIYRGKMVTPFSLGKCDLSHWD